MNIQKMRDDLDYWIYIGIADDIVNMMNQRLEYKHLVLKYKNIHLDEDIPSLVLADLDCELKKPALLRPTNYHLIYVSFLKTKEKLCRYFANMMNSLIRKS